MSFLPYMWLALTILLLLLGYWLSYEITFWLSVDAFVVMIVAFLGASLVVQLIVAGVLAVVLLLWARKLSFASLRPLRDTETIRANPADVVGRHGIVVISIDGGVKRGLVNLSGDKWVAAAEEGEKFAQGEEIEVASLRGQTVVVRRVSG